MKEGELRERNRKEREVWLSSYNCILKHMKFVLFILKKFIHLQIQESQWKGKYVYVVS